MHTAYVFTKEAVPLLCRNLSKKCNLTGRQHQGGILLRQKKILLYVYILLPAQLCC